MANEISATTNVSITLSGQSASGNTTYRADLAGDFVGEEQNVGTSAEALDFGDVTSPKILYVRNLDDTNYVEIDAVNTMDGFPQKLMPGDAIILLPQTSTVYAKANTASVKIFFIAG